MINSEFKPTIAYTRQCARAYFRVVILKDWWIVPIVLILVGSLIYNTSLVAHGNVVGSVLFWIGVFLILIGFSLYQWLLKTICSEFSTGDRIVKLSANDKGLTVKNQSDETATTRDKEILWDNVSDVREVEGCLLVYEGKAITLIVPLALINEEMATCIKERRRCQHVK